MASVRKPSWPLLGVYSEEMVNLEDSMDIVYARRRPFISACLTHTWPGKRLEINMATPAVLEEAEENSCWGKVRDLSLWVSLNNEFLGAGRCGPLSALDMVRWPGA